MNATYEGHQTQFRLVSPLYGQGTTACWYLTMLSCIICWIFHPKKGRSDSLDLNFLTILTFPTIASIHMIIQARSFDQKTANGSAAETVQELRAIEASLTIPEAFILVQSVSVRLCSAIGCSRRALLQCTIGWLCLAAEIVLYISVPQARINPGDHSFQRRHLTNCDSLFFITIVFYISAACYLGGLYFLFLRSCFRKVRRKDRELEGLGHMRRSLLSRLKEFVKYDVHDSSYKRRMTLAGIPAALLGVVISVVPFAIQSRQESDLRVSSFFDLIYSNALPSDGAGIQELDQAVALLGGVIVLGITLFNTVHTRYQDWKAARAEANSQQRVDDVQLGNLHVQRVSEGA